MAIAGIFALHVPQSRDDLLKSLGNMPQILELKPVDTGKLAISLELPGSELTAFLKKLSDLEDILNVEVIFVNYEDDLDTEGHMEIPPEARQYE